MGVLIDKFGDPVIYKDAYEEAQRIIRISDEFRILLESVAPKTPETHTKNSVAPKPDKTKKSDKLSTSKLAKKLGIKTNELTEKLIADGYVETDGKNQKLTEKGINFRGESKSGRYGDYVLWPEGLEL